MRKEEKEKILITLDDHMKECENWQYLKESRKSYLKKERDIITLLKNKYPCRDSFNLLEFEEAKKIYNCYKKLNRLNDRVLELENDFYMMEKRKKFIEYMRTEADDQEIKLKELIKKYNYNINIKYYSWLASLENLEGQKLYFNFCM